MASLPKRRKPFGFVVRLPSLKVTASRHRSAEVYVETTKDKDYTKSHYFGFVELLIFRNGSVVHRVSRNGR